jgi:hypothetical protein
MERMLTNHSRVSGFRTVVLLFLPLTVSALTRWSTLHVIPDADFLSGWNCVAEYQGYYYANDSESTVFKNAGLARIGCSEWADFQAGYAGGITLAFKAKILSEKPSSWFPSAAIGVHDILHHQEDFFYNHATDRWKPEYFIALGKSIEAIRLRLHLGFESMPDVPSEYYNYFFGIEKYMGGNVYLTLEAFRRDKVLRPSLFGTMRLFNQHMEISAGAVDLKSMFFDDQNKFGFSFIAPQPQGLVRPGFWFGVRLLGNLGIGGAYAGFGSVEEQLAYQNGLIRVMRHDVDSLKHVLVDYDERIDTLNKSFNRVADSAIATNDQTRLKRFALEKLILLSTLFNQDNIDAAQIKAAQKELIKYADIIVPSLLEISLDNTQDRKARSQAMTMLGEIGTVKAANAVFDVLAQTQDPDVKIEGLIAIGKMKDRRAGYLLDQLASDPNEAVAFTATEVLQKLEKRAPHKDAAPPRPASALPAAIPESKIKGDNNAAFHSEKAETLSHGAEHDAAPKAPAKAAPDASKKLKPKSAAAPAADTVKAPASLFNVNQPPASDKAKGQRFGKVAPSAASPQKPATPLPPRKPVQDTARSSTPPGGGEEIW